MQGANSDDEEVDNFNMNDAQLKDLESPIKDDAYEGLFVNEIETEDSSPKPIQLTEDSE